MLSNCFRIAVAGLLLCSTPIWLAAQSSGGVYAIPRSSIDGGAQRVSAGDRELVGSVGQADAAPPQSGGNFSLRGGFHRASGSNDLIFADGFQP